MQQLVLQREVDALALAAVAEGGVVDEDAAHGLILVCGFLSPALRGRGIEGERDETHPSPLTLTLSPAKPGERETNTANKKPRSNGSGVAQGYTFDGPRLPGGNDHERAHSLRDGNRDRENAGWGKRVHRDQSMSRVRGIIHPHFETSTERVEVSRQSGPATRDVVLTRSHPMILDFWLIVHHNYSIGWIARDTLVQWERGNTDMDGQSREQSRDLVLKGAKRSPLTKWKCWKSWAKETKAVIGCPSECQKRRDFQGGLDFDEKGGGGRGGQKCEILGENAVQSGQTRSI